MRRTFSALLPLASAMLGCVLLYSIPSARADHGSAAPADDPIPPIPINFDVVEKDGQPIADIEWLAPQLADAAEHYNKLGLRFAVTALRHHAGKTRIETRARS